MKHSLQLKLGQHLTLTPQLQQSIRLLQLSTLELNQELEQMLQDNPLLEREEEDEASFTSPNPLPIPPRQKHKAPKPLPQKPGSRDTETATSLDDADWNDYSSAGGDDEDTD